MISKIQNALLIQTAFIGDVVLTTPMIAAFRKHIPEARLTVMVKPEAVSILRDNPAVDELLVIDKKGAHRGLIGMLRMIRSIRSKQFDLLLSPHKSHRTGFLALASGIPWRVGYQNAGLSRLAYHRRLSRPENQPEIERLLLFLQQATPGSITEIDTQNASRDLQIHVGDEARADARNLLAKLDAVRPILIAPSSVWPTKRWTPWGFAELIVKLAERYHKPVLLVGSKGDREIADEALRYLKLGHPDWESRGKVHNVCGETSLPALYALMEKSLLLVSNDSAPVHFGCAAGIPVVAIFGPTVPALGYAPIAKRSAVAQLEDLECRPCGTHGHKVCPLEHFRCMKDLSADQILEVVERVML
ncbi:MAG: glycosyltransferase family 9 protein [bacterium]|nr:glycosyltransferase family 9 protein [bacterium]